MKLRLNGRRFEGIEEIQAESRLDGDADAKWLPAVLPIM
jgi:hypothetical protein